MYILVVLKGLIKGEEITQFHQRNQMISENARNALMRIGGSIYKLYPS